MTDGDDEPEEESGPSGERRSSHIGPGSTAGTPPGRDDPGEQDEPGDPAAAGEPADAVDVAPDDGAAGGGDGGTGDGGDDAPLSDLRADVDERRGGEEDAEDLFSEMAAGDVDEDDVWEALSASADDPLVESDLGPDAAAADRDVTVVDKSLCHGCEHFADPPDTACTHDGTTIEAEVDTDHFRVVDCPVVEERREMEASDFSADEG